MLIAEEHLYYITGPDRKGRLLNPVHLRSRSSFLRSSQIVDGLKEVGLGGGLKVSKKNFSFF